MANEKDKMAKLISKRNELQHQVTQAVLKNDPLEYVDIFSEIVPKILSIDKEIHEWELKGNDRRDLITKVEVIHDNSDSELEKFERELTSYMRQKGYKSLSPLTKDRKRIRDLLKKSHPEGAASRMQKLTKDYEKLFRRGKELIKNDRPDLAKGFWIQLGESFGIDLPSQWTKGKGRKNSAESKKSIQIKSPDDFDSSEKEASFNAIIRDVNHYFREMAENDRDVGELALNTFISLVSMLGSDATNILQAKINQRNS